MFEFEDNPFTELVVARARRMGASAEAERHARLVLALMLLPAASVQEEDERWELFAQVTGLGVHAMMYQDCA